MLNKRRLIRSATSVVFSFSIMTLTILTLATPTNAQSTVEQETAQATDLQPTIVQPDALAGYPPDPTSDIPWSGSAKEWSDVVAAFATARQLENAQLGTALPTLIFPTAAVWEGMSTGERALWLINEERRARGLAPLQALERNVTDVAQTYAEFLLANNVFDHDSDARSPWDRLADNPTIGACHDFLSIAENIYFQGTTGTTPIPMVIEQAVYKMIYDDSTSQWGHRHAILWTPYTENNGAADREGFLGIGHAHGGYTSPFNGRFYQNTDMIVMNFFDPCANWVETEPVTPVPTAPPSPTVVPSPSASPAPTTPSATLTPVATPRPDDTPTPPLTRSVAGRVVMGAASSNLAVDAATGLAGVKIVSSNGQSTLSDQNGYFTLQGLPPQSHMLTANKAGYVFAPTALEANVTNDDLYGITFTGSVGAVGTDLSYSMHLPLILPSR